MYMALKHSHMLFVAISGVLFLLRGGWMLMDSSWLQKKWVKIVPHINDTLLLLTALSLCVLTQQYPLQQSWLTVKVIALLVYIGLGMVALKKGKTKPVRALAFVAALLVFAFTATVARSHSPLGLFG